jgi:flagellar protein FliO/FliZ
MDAESYLRFVLALVVVVGMILAVTWVMKRLGVGNNAMGPLGRKRRLRTVESATIDSRHRLVLVRRDAVEHLVLISPTGSQLIEAGIAAPADDNGSTESSPIGFQFKSLLGQASSAKDTTP